MIRLSPRDVALALCVPLIWGMGFVFAKAAIAHFPPIFLMALRFAVTAAALVFFVKPPVHAFGALFVIAFVSAAIQYSLTFNGLAGLDASTAVLVVQLEVPFLVLLGALLLGETPGWRQVLGIVVAFVGVGFIAGEPRIIDAWVSVSLVASGAFVWALGQVMLRELARRLEGKGQPPIDGFALIAWIAMFAAPQLMVFSLFFENNHAAYLASANTVVWGTVIYLGLVMTALGYGIWYSLITRHPVSRVGPFLLLLPVFSVIASVIILGEKLTVWTVAGGLLVLAGLAILSFGSKPEKAATR
ncbi:MAG: EamA family transporter [Pseudomonadota bacterium]